MLFSFFVTYTIRNSLHLGNETEGNALLLTFPLDEIPKRYPENILHRVETYSGNIWITLGDSTEKAMAPHSNTLAWKIPWMEEPGRLQSMGSHRVGHD